MIQNILALIIVFAAAIISVYYFVRSITSKKTAACDGCSACEIKDAPKLKRYVHFSKIDLQNLKISGNS